MGEEDVAGIICIGLVSSVMPHPTSKKLKICDIFCGDDIGTRSVVTNVESIDSGKLVALALVGSKTPGSGIDIRVPVSVVFK
eukprot:jgi/Picre1/27717/NNA_000681.t1